MGDWLANSKDDLVNNIKEPVGKTLLVVESEQTDLVENSTRFLLDSVSNARQVSLLWMNDAPHGKLLNALKDSGIRVDLIPAGGPILRELSYGINSEFRAWFRKLISIMGEVQDFWIAHLSELNFMHPAMGTLIRFNVFHDQIMGDEYNKCVVVGENNFVDLCRQLCGKQSVDFSGKRISSSQKHAAWEYIRALLRWGFSLIGEVISLSLARSIFKHSHAEVLVYAQYPRNWRRSGSKAGYRFVGQVDAVLGDMKKNVAYLITLARQDQIKIKRLRAILKDGRALRRETSNLPFVLIERYGSLIGIIKNYFNPRDILKWARRWKRAKDSQNLYWHGVNISRLFEWSVINTCIVDWPTNRYLEYCMSSALRHSQASKIIVPIYELAEGRSVTRAANRLGLPTIGLQHNAYSLGHRWRVVTTVGLMAGSVDKNASPQPDMIAVEGQIAQDWFQESDYSSDNVVVIGAPRVMRRVPSPDYSLTSKSILVLGEYHRPRLLLNWCVQNLFDIDNEIVLRPHPTFYHKTLEWLSEQPESIRESVRISPQGLSLEDELAELQPLCILASVSGAAVEVAFSGWPVGIISSNWLANNSPMAAADDDRLFISNDEDETKSWIDKMSNDIEFRRSYGQICQGIAEKHFVIIKDQAAQNLADLL